MRSPFSGMDPYIEARTRWRGTQSSLLVAMSAVLQPQLIPRYIARLESGLTLQLDESGTGDGAGSHCYGEAERRERRHPEETIPEIIQVPEMTLPHRWIAIRDLKDREVVTVIEVLSYWNKREPGLSAYRRKQQNLLLSDTSLVEIDLLRWGKHTVAAPESRLRPSHYRVCVHRAQANEFEVIRFGVRDPLPNVAIPLRGDPDVVLHLPAVLGRCYEEGAYAYDIDYTAEPDPPLDGNDAEWARQQIRHWRES